MTKKKTITWAAVIDGAKAKFYTKGPEKRLGDLNNTMTAYPIRTDKPTGRRELGRVYDSAGSGRHIIEPHTNDRTQQRRRFAKDVAEFLDNALKEEKYTRLVIVAPPKILGFLRKELSKEVRDVTALELDKDFMQLSPHQIQEQLEKIVYI